MELDGNINNRYSRQQKKNTTPKARLSLIGAGQIKIEGEETWGNAEWRSFTLHFRSSELGERGTFADRSNHCPEGGRVGANFRPERNSGHLKLAHRGKTRGVKREIPRSELSFTWSDGSHSLGMTNGGLKFVDISGGRGQTAIA